MLTNVYIDAFNFYYGCLKDAPHLKWLNLSQYCQLEFPLDHVNTIHYFTALIKSHPPDPQRPQRQQIYLRAIATLPNVAVTLGHYLQKPTNMPLAKPPPGGPDVVRVLKSEEKGSDVNLATRLLIDAYEGAFQQAVVISNDSDLVFPIDFVQQRLGLPLTVLFPCHGPKRKPSYYLSKCVTSAPIVNKAHLAAAQFPDQLADANGNFHKPPTWV